MSIFFYLAAAVATASSLLVVTGRNPVHALLNLVVSLLAVAAIFLMIGAPFAGLLEVIVYAGAIMVLFVFVVMMLNLGRATVEQESRWLQPRVWIAPAGLAALLLAGLLAALFQGGQDAAGVQEVGARAVGLALFGPYVLAVELASMLLLAALVAAYHLGKQD